MNITILHAVLFLLYLFLGNIYAAFELYRLKELINDCVDIDAYDHGGRTRLRRLLRTTIMVVLWPLLVGEVFLHVLKAYFAYYFLSVSVDNIKLAKRSDNKFGTKKK